MIYGYRDPFGLLGSSYRQFFPPPFLLFSCNVSCSHPSFIPHTLLAFYPCRPMSFLFLSICCTQVLQNHLKVLRGRCHVKTSAVDPFLLSFLEVMRPLTDLPHSTLAQN